MDRADDINVSLLLPLLAVNSNCCEFGYFQLPKKEMDGRLDRGRAVQRSARRTAIPTSDRILLRFPGGRRQAGGTERVFRHWRTVRVPFNTRRSGERYGSYDQTVISMRANLAQVVAQFQQKSLGLGAGDLGLGWPRIGD